jgi:hypothetical protein
MSVILDNCAIELIEVLRDKGFVAEHVNFTIVITIEPANAIELERLAQLLQMYE